MWKWILLSYILTCFLRRWQRAQKACFIAGMPTRASLAWEHSLCVSYREKFTIFSSGSLYWDANVLPPAQSRTHLCSESLQYWDGDTSLLMHHTTLTSPAHRLLSSPPTGGQAPCPVLVTACSFCDVSTLTGAASVVDFSHSSSSLSFPLSHHMVGISWTSQTPLSVQCCLLTDPIWCSWFCVSPSSACFPLAGCWRVICHPKHCPSRCFCGWNNSKSFRVT